MILMTVLFVGMTFYSVNTLAPVTQEAVDIYTERVEYYEAELPKATAAREAAEAELEAEEARVAASIPEGATEEEIKAIEEADEKLTDAREAAKEARTRENTAKQQLDKYSTRTKTYPQKDTYYMLSMGLLLVAYLGAMMYIQYAKTAAFAAPLSAIFLLLGIGKTYQFLFEIDQKGMLALLAAILLAVATYAIWRRIKGTSYLFFWLVILAIFGLFILNFTLGKDNGTGASLWIKTPLGDIQPGEFIKVLLIFLGALVNSTKRSFIYTAVCVASCGGMLLLRDMGSAFVIFFVFVLMTYLLWDNAKLSLGFIGGAAVLFAFALTKFDYARNRFLGLLQAMKGAQDSQQADALRAVIFGGGRGFGMEESLSLYSVYSAQSDVAIAGLLAVFGITMFLAVMCGYAILTILPKKNFAATPGAYYITCQVSLMVAVQVILNFLGSIDAFPFTGIVAPFISDGGSSLVAYGILMGGLFASLNPKFQKRKVMSDAK